jgi:sporulation protein YlmC with PRC-barrel domain
MGNAGGMGGGIGNAGGMGMGMGNSFGIQTRDASRINSQSPNHASPTGIAHANRNSVLAGTNTMTTSSAGRLNAMFPGTRTTMTVSSGTLSGLTTGMTLFSNGTAVGTVQQIRTTGSGSVAVVVIQGTNGGFYAVPASKLSLSSGTLSTTARLNGINSSSQARLNSQGPLHASTTGIAHANIRSVLAGGMVVSGSLAGLATGLTVNTSIGTTLGTVSQIVTDSSGNIRLVIVTSSTGQTYRLAPTSLSLSGGVVTTTQTFG